MLKQNFILNMKKNLSFRTIFNLVIGFLFARIFIGVSKKLEKFGVYYYCESNDIKKIIDTIYNTFYFLINTFSILVLLIYMSTKKEEAEKG